MAIYLSPLEDNILKRYCMKFTIKQQKNYRYLNI